MQPDKMIAEKQKPVLHMLILVMIITPIIYGFVIWSSAKGSGSEPGNPLFTFDILISITAVLVILSFFIGNKMLNRPVSDEKEIAGNRFISLIIRLALSEAVAVVAFVNYMSARNFTDYSYFAGGAILLMIVHSQIVFSKDFNKNKRYSNPIS